MSGLAPAAPLERLGREHPEWGSWLALLAAARAESADPVYDSAVPDAPESPGAAPLLHDSTLALPRSLVDRWVREVLTTAAAGGGCAASLAATARSSALDAFDLLAAAVGGAGVRLQAIERATGAEDGCLAAVASIAAMPLLQACARRWASLVPAEWDHGYCPICGAWPAMAEARGLEGERRLRCARCGGDWRTEWLRCPFCGNRDHSTLGALVQEGAIQAWKVETCAECRRYVKTLTTLRPTPVADVAVEDLATIDLDLAALARGCVGAAGLGWGPAVRVVERRRACSWTR